MSNPKLFNRWVLTGRENGIRIYTPKNAMPENVEQVEKEEGFEIKENGEFIKYATTPDGHLKQYTGHYEIKGNALHSYFKNHYLDTIFSILTVDDKVLRIK